MKYWSVVFSRLPASAMALYPFLIFKNQALKLSATIINHEKIHFRQQQELLIVFFYLLYFLHYLFNLVKFKNHNHAYFNICFEKEAYAKERDLDYLKQRKPYSWFGYL